MDQEQIYEELNSLICECKEDILPTKWIHQNVIGAPYRVDYKQYLGWYTKAFAFLKLFLQEDSDFLLRFSECKENRYSLAESSIVILENLMEYMKKGFVVPKKSDAIDTSAELNRIFERFHRVVKQLRNRHDGRPTLDVNDEYDVQDLLHALLKLYFNDIRAEEWTPSYAGKSARMDFLLKHEGIVIEVKKTRQGLTEKEVGDQLIVDADRYRVHPDCKKLICFIYEPEGRIGNTEGLVRDINGHHEGFIEVVIEPNV